MSLKNLFISWPGRLAKELSVPKEEAEKIWMKPTPGAAKNWLAWLVVIASCLLSYVVRSKDPAHVFDEPRHGIASALFLFGGYFGTHLFLLGKFKLIVQRHREKLNSPLHSASQADQ